MDAREQLVANPLLGKAMALLLLGEDGDNLEGDLKPVLAQAPVEQLQASYDQFQAVLTALMYDPQPDRLTIGAADRLVTAAANALRDRGRDPMVGLATPTVAAAGS